MKVQRSFLNKSSIATLMTAETPTGGKSAMNNNFMQPDFIDFLLILWLLMGPSIYMETHMSVNRTPQRIILFILCGPVMWFLALLRLIFSLINTWMTKE